MPEPGVLKHHSRPRLVAAWLLTNAHVIDTTVYDHPQSCKGLRGGDIIPCNQCKAKCNASAPAWQWQRQYITRVTLQAEMKHSCAKRSRLPVSTATYPCIHVDTEKNREPPGWGLIQHSRPPMLPSNKNREAQAEPAQMSNHQDSVKPTDFYQGMY